MAQTRRSVSGIEDGIAVRPQGGENGDGRYGASFSAYQRMQDRLSRVFNRWVLGSIIGVAALALNLYRLGAPSMWFDEIL